MSTEYANGTVCKC